MTPNTDSRELDELIDAIPAYSVMAEGIKDELRAAILAYTANKQRQIELQALKYALDKWPNPSAIEKRIKELEASIGETNKP